MNAAAPELQARCAMLGRASGEPLAGTAPTEAAWLLLEHETPWGRDALRESGVDPRVVAQLAGAAAAGVRVVLIRRPGTRPAGRRAFVAWIGESPWLRRIDDATPNVVGALDLDGLARGVHPAVGVPHDAPLLAVCTNGRRDACCAVHGTAAARTLRDAFPEETWECTHLGGHRFAATMIALPRGFCFGRLDPEDAVRVARSLAAGEVDVEHLRGRAGRRPEVQAAEAHARREHGLVGVDALRIVDVHRDTRAATIRFESADGRTLRVRVREDSHDAGPLSCGGDPERVVVWRAA